MFDFEFYIKKFTLVIQVGLFFVMCLFLFVHIQIHKVMGKLVRKRKGFTVRRNYLYFHGSQRRKDAKIARKKRENAVMGEKK